MEGTDPHLAARQVQDLLNFSEAELDILIHELDQTDEDPILAVRLNPNWIARYGEAEACAVLDFIGSFAMPPGARRDCEPGHRFLFHFNISSDISVCQAATMRAFPNAFALSPLALAAVAAATAGGAVGVNDVPLASCAIIHKLAVRQDDVQSFPFFYM